MPGPLIHDVDEDSEHVEEGSDAEKDVTDSEAGEEDAKTSPTGTGSEMAGERRPAIGVQSRFAALNLSEEEDQSEEETEDEVSD